MVRVFKTDVRKTIHAEDISDELQQHFPGSDIHFDLEDCDNVLRMEGEHIQDEKVKELLGENGFICEELL